MDTPGLARGLAEREGGTRSDASSPKATKTQKVVAMFEGYTYLPQNMDWKAQAIAPFSVKYAAAGSGFLAHC
jgi:hypothetical protein